VVTPDSVRLISGATQQYKAVTYGQDSSVMSYVTPVWATSINKSTVSSTGLFTAGNVDCTKTGTVTATANGVTGTVRVTVRPAPVLTRMVITPDTVTVPVNASRQFTVTAYDQLDSLMTISPVWTVSDTTATVSQTGIFTAGNGAGNVYVTASANGISVNAVVTMAYTCTVNDKYEAESCSGRTTRPTLQTCTDIGGGQNFTGIWSGDYFRYSTLNVPVAGRYNIRFRVSTTAPARISVGHGGMNFGYVDLPSTGGVWKTISDTMTLPALTYTAIHSVSGTFKFNWFSIDNCAEDTSANFARMTVSQEKIQQPEEEAAAIVYPNPTAGQVTVEVPEHRYNTMILLNMDGKVVRRWYIAPADRKIVKDLRFLQSGMYLIRLEGSGGTKTLKLMKGE
jgi:hypothetical protein